MTSGRSSDPARSAPLPPDAPLRPLLLDLALAGCRDGDLEAGLFAPFGDLLGFDALLAIIGPEHAHNAAKSNKRSEDYSTAQPCEARQNEPS